MPSPAQLARVAIVAGIFERALLDASNDPVLAASTSLERARGAVTVLDYLEPGDDRHLALRQILEPAALDIYGGATLPADLDHVCDAILLALSNHARSAARIELQLEGERGDELHDAAPAGALAEGGSQDEVDGAGFVVAHANRVRALGEGVEA